MALTDAELQARLECFVTGETRWLGPYAPTVKPGRHVGHVSPSPCRRTPKPWPTTIRPGAAHAFTANVPVAQLLLKIEDEQHKPRGCRDFLPIVVRSVKVSDRRERA